MTVRYGPPATRNVQVLAAFSYDPIVNLDFGPFSLSPHGMGIAIGFLIGARVMLPSAEKKGISADDVSALLVRAAIGAIIGARLAYVINHPSDYIDAPLEIIKIWQGGISLLGGFAGAIALALPEMRKRRLSFWQVMDAAAPGMAVGVIVGRIGDLIVADHLGKATDFASGYRCPPASVDTAVPCIAGPGNVVHQPALYDFVLTIIVLVVLLRLRKRPHYDGYPHHRVRSPLRPQPVHRGLVPRRCHPRPRPDRQPVDGVAGDGGVRRVVGVQTTHTGVGSME